MNNELNSYELSRCFINFAFDNPEKISPNHYAIYFFAIEHCNRLGWKTKFGFPTMMACDAVGIKKPQTFIKYFNDLEDWGFIKVVERSKNQYSANIISLISATPKKGEAMDKAMVKHAASKGQSNSPINKQVNNITIKSITSPPEGVAPLYFYIAKGFHNLFLKKGETKTLNNASLSKWVEDTRKIIEVDKVPISQLIAIKRYWEECESGARGTDNFWFNTINSMSSFRKVDKDGVYHYDKITTSVKKWLNANPELQGEIFKIEQNLIAKSNGN